MSERRVEEGRRENNSERAKSLTFKEEGGRGAKRRVEGRSSRENNNSERMSEQKRGWKRGEEERRGAEL